MEASAIIRFVRQSPRKVRVVADQIRGKKVEEAMAMLRLQPRKAAKTLAKLLTSAVANAENNNQADVDGLVVKKVFVDVAPTLKRWMPRAMGRANRVNKRSSHVTIVVGETN
jgi:large subunit ribosomal protein L22